MTHKKAKAGASNVVSYQISIAYTSVYTLINFGASNSFVVTAFIKRIDMVYEFLDVVCSISLSSSENLI